MLRNLNPEFNYALMYPNVHKEELQYRVLEFTVKDWDRFTANDFIGRLEIKLSGMYNSSLCLVWSSVVTNESVSLIKFFFNFNFRM